MGLHGQTLQNRRRSAGLEVAALEAKQIIIPENSLALCNWNDSDNQWKPIHEKDLNVFLQNHGEAF